MDSPFMRVPRTCVLRSSDRMHYGVRSSRHDSRAAICTYLNTQILQVGGTHEARLKIKDAKGGSRRNRDGRKEERQHALNIPQECCPRDPRTHPTCFPRAHFNKAASALDRTSARMIQTPVIFCRRAPLRPRPHSIGA